MHWLSVKDCEGVYNYFLEDQVSAVTVDSGTTYVVLKSGICIEVYEKTPEQILKALGVEVDKDSVD